MLAFTYILLSSRAMMNERKINCLYVLYRYQRRKQILKYSNKPT